jgi:hypothetical protein
MAGIGAPTFKRFAGTTLQAPRLVNYGDAFKPTQDFFRRLSDIQQRKQKLEDERNFLLERDRAKQDFQERLQGDRLQNQYDIANMNAEAQKDLQKNRFKNQKDFADKNAALQRELTKLREKGQNKRAHERNAIEWYKATHPNIRGGNSQFSTPEIDAALSNLITNDKMPTKKDVIRKDKYFDPAAINRFAPEYEKKISTFDTKIKNKQKELQQTFNDIKKSHLLSASIKKKLKTIDDLKNLDINSIKAKQGELKANAAKSKLMDVYNSLNDLKFQKSKIEKEYWDKIDNTNKLEMPVYGDVPDYLKRKEQLTNELNNLYILLSQSKTKLDYNRVKAMITYKQNELGTIDKNVYIPSVKAENSLKKSQANYFEDNEKKALELEVELAKHPEWDESKKKSIRELITKIRQGTSKK